MRRLFLIGVAVAAFLVVAGSAEASCGTAACLNRKINALTNALRATDRVLNATDRAFNALNRCLAEKPASAYGDPTGSFGYLYNPGAGMTSFLTWAIAPTNPGDVPDAWLLSDRCNTRTAISQAHIARSTSGIAPISPWVPQTLDGH